MTIRKSERVGLHINLLFQHRYSSARVCGEFFRTQSAVIPVGVTVKSQADSGLAHLANLSPHKWPPKIRSLALVRTAVALIETINTFAGDQAGTKKNIQRDSQFTRDGPGV